MWHNSCYFIANFFVFWRHRSTIHRDLSLERIASMLSQTDAIVLRFNGRTSLRRPIVLQFLSCPIEMPISSGTEWLPLCIRRSEESGNFHVNFLFFSWPHVTVRATLARPDDTALAAIDRDGWNAKLGGWYAPTTSRFLQEAPRSFPN